jgi:hypothetical protein
MSIQAANAVALPYLSPCMVERAFESLPARNGAGGQRSSYGVMARSKAVAIAANFCSQIGDENFDPLCVSRFVSRRLLGHGFGALHAPCGNSLFCFGYAALRVTVSLQILFGEYAEKISPDPP